LERRLGLEQPHRPEAYRNSDLNRAAQARGGPFEPAWCEEDDEGHLEVVRLYKAFFSGFSTFSILVAPILRGRFILLERSRFLRLILVELAFAIVGPRAGRSR